MCGVIFTLLTKSQEKLWFIECEQLDVQIRPVFADSVTYVTGNSHKVVYKQMQLLDSNETSKIPMVNLTLEIFVLYYNYVG